MVDRIELTLPASGTKPCRVETIRNVPPPPTTGPITKLIGTTPIARKNGEGMLSFCESAPLSMHCRSAARFRCKAPASRSSSRSPPQGWRQGCPESAYDSHALVAAGEEWVQQDNGQWVLATRSKLRFQLSLVNSVARALSKTNSHAESEAPLRKQVPRRQGAPRRGRWPRRKQAPRLDQPSHTKTSLEKE